MASDTINNMDEILSVALKETVRILLLMDCDTRTQSIEEQAMDLLNGVAELFENSGDLEPSYELQRLRKIVKWYKWISAKV